MSQDDDARTRERVEALETRIAHLDSVVDDLNTTITDQWRAIDRLTRTLAALDERIGEAESRSGLAGPQPPPPHY